MVEISYSHDGDGSATIEVRALSFITAKSGQHSVVLDINGETVVLYEWELKKPKRITLNAHVKAEGIMEVGGHEVADRREAMMEAYD